MDLQNVKQQVSPSDRDLKREGLATGVGEGVFTIRCGERVGARDTVDSLGGDFLLETMLQPLLQDASLNENIRPMAREPEGLVKEVKEPNPERYLKTPYKTVKDLLPAALLGAANSNTLFNLVKFLLLIMIMAYLLKEILTPQSGSC